MLQRIVRMILASVLIGAFNGSTASALTPGPEFQVNGEYPSVAALSKGRFVVVWQSSDEDGSGYGIYGQRYNAAGNPAGKEFRVNTRTSHHQVWPSVAGLANGGFVVVWTSERVHDAEGFPDSEIRGQRFDATGTPVGGEFRLNPHSTRPYTATVIGRKNGGFLVAWGAADPLNGADIISVQPFTATGRLGTRFKVAESEGGLSQPSIAALDKDNFVIIWSTRKKDYGKKSDIHGQHLTPEGPHGVGFRVNTFRPDLHREPTVAAIGEKKFVVTWTASGRDPDRWVDVYGQRYNAQGRAGLEFRVSSIAEGSQHRPVIASLGDDRFVVVFNHSTLDGSRNELVARRFKNGLPMGPQFPVSVNKTDHKHQLSVAALDNGGFVAVWMARNQDGPGYTIYGRRFTNTTP